MPEVRRRRIGLADPFVHRHYDLSVEVKAPRFTERSPGSPEDHGTVLEAYINGIRTSATQPGEPSRLRRETVPPCASAICRTSASPTPEPSRFVV